VTPLLVYGGYQLSRTAGGLELRGGLLTERRIVIQPERIQTLTWVDHPIGRRDGVRSLQFSTAEVGSGGGAQNGEVTADLDRLVPAAPDAEVDTIATLAGRPSRIADGDLRPVSPLTIRRAAFRWSLPTLLAPVLWFVSPWLLAVVPVWWAAAWFAARRRFSILGFATDGIELVGRTGWWVTQTTRLSIDRIQGVRLTATPFQRRLGLATVVVGTAGVRGHTAVVVPDLPMADAEPLARRLALDAARAPDPFEL